MCFRIILLIYLTNFLTVYNSNCVKGSFIRQTRTQSSNSDDNSKSFSDALKIFLSNIFGTNSNETDKTGDPTIGIENSTTPGFYLNETDISPTEIANQTYTMIAFDHHSYIPQTKFTDSTTKTTTEPEVEISSPGVFTTMSPAFNILSTTAKPESGRCNYDTHLKYYCILPYGMPEADLTDLYYLFFSDAVIDALQTACPRGSWCLQDPSGYWESLLYDKIESATESLLSANMCTKLLLSCVNNMIEKFVDCSSNPQMQITIQVMQLICDLKEKINLTSTCYKEVLRSLHITLADTLRSEDNLGNEVSSCQSPEAYMTKRLICTEVACPKQSQRFHSFSPWAWFMSVEDDLIIECGLTPSSCDVSEKKTEGMTKIKMKNKKKKKKRRRRKNKKKKKKNMLSSKTG